MNVNCMNEGAFRVFTGASDISKVLKFGECNLRTFKNHE